MKRWIINDAITQKLEYKNAVKDDDNQMKTFTVLLEILDE